MVRFPMLFKHKGAFGPLVTEVSLYSYKMVKIFGRQEETKEKVPLIN